MHYSGTGYIVYVDERIHMSDKHLRCFHFSRDQCWPNIPFLGYRNQFTSSAWLCRYYRISCWFPTAIAASCCAHTGVTVLCHCGSVRSARRGCCFIWSWQENGHRGSRQSATLLVNRLRSATFVTDGVASLYLFQFAYSVTMQALDNTTVQQCLAVHN